MAETSGESQSDESKVAKLERLVLKELAAGRTEDEVVATLVKADWAEGEARALVERLAAKAPAKPLRKAPSIDAEQEHILRTGFCKACHDDSTSHSTGGISTVNGIGRKFYGGAEKCATCGSVVRVLWFVLIDVPIIPLGTYRYQSTEKGGLRERFLARQTETRWPQVFTHWGVGLAIGAILTAIIATYISSKSR